MIRQIPVQLLPASMSVRLPVHGSDRGGGFGEAFEVGNVRVERTLPIRENGYQLQDTTNALVFVDAANSTGAVELPAGTKVSFDGGAHWSTVNACHAFEDFAGHVHHWELEVG